jgi:hypothetical protein
MPRAPSLAAAGSDLWMSERLTTTPEKQSRALAWAGHLSRRGRTLAGAAVVLVVLGVAIAIVVFVNNRGSSQTTNGPVAVPIKPVPLNAGGLATLARAIPQPIYWAGPRRGYFYELTRAANRNVYSRYLPPGVNAGAKGAKYLIVATYPFPDAFAALEKVADGYGIKISGGGLALVDKSYPKSVHLAFPNVDYQVEVFDPSPAKALEVATSGDVRPAG